MTVLTRLEDGVLTVLLDRPDRLNALDAATADALLDALTGAAGRGARAVLLAGGGRAFCAGADTGADLPVADLLPDAEVQASSDGTPTTGGAVPMLDRANALAVALSRIEVPVVVAVHGVSAGLGTSLALAADLLVVGSSARLVLGFSRIGLVPDGGATHWLRRRVGLGPALGMALLEDALDGPRAHALGIAQRCVADDQVRDEALALARQVASAHPAVAAARLAVRGSGRPELDLLDALWAESRLQLDLIREASSQTHPRTKAGTHA